MKKAGLADLKRDDKLVELIADAEKFDRFIASFEEKRKQQRVAAKAIQSVVYAR